MNVRHLQTSMRRALLFLLGAWTSLSATASPPWLIATPEESARAGAPILLDVVKPAARAEWPASLRLRIYTTSGDSELELTAVGTDAPAGQRRPYRGVLPGHLSGLVRANLADAPSNRLALLVTAADAIDAMATPLEAEDRPAAKPRQTNSPLRPADEPALSANEPMYFVLGGSGGTTARFQLSFKYRLFDPESLPVEWFGPLSGLHFGYTQTSLWDLGEDSAPFRDTSYRPSFFWQGVTSGGALMPDLLRGGFEHESNGKDGADSRSLNILFAQPVWRADFADGRTLVFAPRLYGYLDKDDNPDIHRYRGYADWLLRYGREDGWLLSTQLRRGTAGRGSAQIDLSYPLRRPLFTRAGGFLHVQLFKGYGESLLDYNVDRDWQARVGFSIVR